MEKDNQRVQDASDVITCVLSLKATLEIENAAVSDNIIIIYNQ